VSINGGKMLDISTINQSSFELKINGVEYKVEPCTVKTLKEFISIKSKNSEEAFTEYVSLVKKIIDKNKSNNQIALSTLEDLTFVELNYILAEYMTWMKNIKNSPNL